MDCAMSIQETESQTIFLNMRKSRGPKIPEME